MSDLSTKSTELSEVIRATVDTILMERNYCLPAKVVAYDRTTQYADVQVQLLQGFIDGSTEAIPVIPNVPVKHPRANAGAAFVHMPLVPGDDVTLIFSQRSLDNWKTQGGMQDPNDQRKNHLTDAYALIGGSAIPDAFAPQSENGIEIVNGQTAVIVYPDGKISAENNTAELMNLLSSITEQVALTNDTLSKDTTNTFFGPMKLLHFQDYADIRDELEALKTKLDSFKV